MPLENEEIRHCRAGVAGGHRPDRCRDEVWRKGQVIDFCEVGDLLAFGEPTALRDIRHDYVRNLLLHHLAEAPAHVEVLADANRGPAAGADLPERVDVLGGDRLLEPEK